MTTNIIFFFSSVAFFYVVAYLAFGMWFRGNRSTYMKIFLAMGLTISTWALFNGLLVLLSEELSQRMYPLFLPLTCIVPALMMLYSLHFTGSKFANSRTLTTVMSIMVTVNVLMILTNPWHHELYSGFDGPLPIAGRWFPVHALIAYSFLLTAYFVFFHFIIKNIRKTPSLLFVGFAMILPVIVNALFTFDILHLGFDITPFAFLIMFFVFSIYSINLRLFDNRRAAFFNLFSRLSDAFLVMDSAGRVTDANPSFKKIFSALELKFHKSTADNVKRFFKSIAIESNPTDVFEQFNPQTDEIHNAEITLVQNNRRYYYILSKNNIYERAQYAGSIIILTDITDNQQAKKMQMELEAAMVAENEANERFRIMLDSMPLICNLWSKEYRVFDCNEAALKLYDMKDKKEYMEKFLDLTPEIQPDGRTTVNLAIDVLNKAFSEGSCSFEYLSKKLDGTIIPMGVTLIRVMYKDDYIVVSYGRDLREQKRMTAEIYETAARLEIAVEEAHEANRAKSNFLSQMSHEIRTPLNAITGMTRIGKNAADTERKNYAFDKIKDASTHLLGIINDILDMSKIEANKLELSDENFIFEKMIERIMGFIGFRVEEKCQRLNVNIGGDIPKCLLGDDHRLAQVITNLLANAVKFTPELGSIDFDARLLEDADGFCTIQFTIKDTGIGISDEQQKHLFDPFHQAESSTTRKYGGTGLGLSISKSIVEIMGGRLWVESEPGKGSTFIFTVKMARGMAEITDAGQSQADSGLPDAAGLKGRRILLAEDLEINREIVTSLLEPVQVIVDCAENGAEAVRMFSRSPEQYDLIFMDVQMPEMDGNGATRAIRALDVPNAKTIPIIAMTANVFREDVQECLQSGMNDHIGKPVDPNELLKKLRDYMKIVDKNEKGRL